ncbi:hypothetical protein A6A04_12310 [Paramagnetospirillum marisnigri]|uniref:Prohead serine protease domain-containing protein n=1 Tax=Paramagnetospirillum marisnigri TaxID=1285242 RepID=A0A178MUR1_9PROT|nr:HK97 family phage prohead protease [Paramagnetospirillum marisnigri]OAN54023.1 hypothetical protein A6A04_12310 [Paramagnetospirillum marisnigri]
MTEVKKRMKLAADLSADSNTRRINVICSTEHLDRDGDIIVQHGWHLATYLKNPVVLWAHDHKQPIAVTRSIGVRDGKLQAEIEFPPSGAVRQADEIFALIKLGGVNSISVGFRVIASEPIPGGRGMRITRAELLEISVVSVPAQPEAVIFERSSSDHARAVIADMRRSCAPLPGIDSRRDDIARLRGSDSRREDIARLRGDSKRKHISYTGS